MRIAAYCRVSTDHEDQLNSLENQKAFFVRYAEKYRHQLVRLYADEGITGTSMKKRTEFRKLMADAGAGIFDMVVVKDVSRFARNTVDLLQSIRTLKGMGIATVFLSADMASLGDSEFVLTLFGAMAQEESANLSRRVKFGKRISAEKGRVPPRIYGYERVDNYTLAINPDEAAVVRRIFHMYTRDGYGCRRICRELDGTGATTKYGCAWNPRTVRRILTNPIYCGEYVNGKYEVRDYLEGRAVPVPEERHLHHLRPEWAVITRETFERAREQLELRRRQYDSGVPFREGRFSGRHAFSTLIKCGCCGSSFGRKVYRTSAGETAYWKCTVNDQQSGKACANGTRVAETALLEAMREYLALHIADRESFIRSVVREAAERSGQEGAADEAEKLRRKMESLEKRRDKLYQLYLNDLIDMEALKEKLSRLEAGIEITARRLSLERKKRRSPFVCTAWAGELAGDAHRFLELEGVGNGVMRRIIDHIKVEKDGEVEIYIRNCNRAGEAGVCLSGANS